MTKAQTQSSRYLTSRIAAAHNVLANPKATDVQRHGARCRLNHAIDALNRLRPIPQMKCEFETDRQRRVDTEKRAVMRRARTAA